MGIQEIRKEFEKAQEELTGRQGTEALQELMARYREDERAGVQALLKRAEKQLNALWKVAGAVILPEKEILYLNDSKKLSAKKREELYEVIMQEAVAVGVGYASPERIDEINILQATYEAMRDAISQLSVRPSVLLNDAVTIPGVAIQQVPIIKGDAKSASIAAASIVAKVTRDRLMEKYDAVFPQYGFAAHKGYGAAAHIEALKKYGPCPIHRRSFIGHFTA